MAVSELDGELEQAVETSARQAWCRACGVQARPHGRRVVRVRDLPAEGRPVTLLWIKRVWRCAESRCPARTWLETSGQIRPWASLTERARREACRLVGEDGLDVAGVAAQLGVGWSTVMRAVREYGNPLVDDPARLAGVQAVGVDETTFLSARAGRSTQFVTGIVAMPGPDRACAQLLDIVPGRTRTAVQSWFSACDPGWRTQIRTASLDPYRGYATALTHSLPDAVRVLDAFHVVRLGQAAVDDVRRRRQAGDARVARSPPRPALPRPKAAAPPLLHPVRAAVGSARADADRRRPHRSAHASVDGSRRSCSCSTPTPATSPTPTADSTRSSTGAPGPRCPS